MSYLGSLAGGGLLLLTLSAVDDNLCCEPEQNNQIKLLVNIYLRGRVESVVSNISLLGVLMIYVVQHVNQYKKYNHYIPKYFLVLIY